MRICPRFKRTHRNGVVDPAKFFVYYDGENIPFVTLSTLADACLIARYVSGAPLPDDECREARRILQAIDTDDNQ